MKEDHGSTFSRVAPDVELGEGVQIFGQVNLYGCSIGDHSKVGAFVEVQKNASIGKNVKLSSHSFVCEGVTIEDDVFIGHGVKFINDKRPVAARERGLLTEEDWEVIPTVVRKGASIGTNATILCGVEVGEGAMVGAGAVVTHDVPPRTTVVGNPARELVKGASSSADRIPFLDLKAQYAVLRTDVSRAMQRVLDDTAYIGGPDVAAFENELAAYVGTSHLVAVGSGTAALQLALRAMGVGAGDEVLTHPNTFIATVGAIAMTGARPTFVDIEPGGIWPTVDSFLAATTDQTKVIIPVHLFGFPYPGIEELVSAAAKRGIAVLEDAAQALGARLGGKMVGSFGAAAAFSFYPGKNLGAYGDAGAVATNDPELARRIIAVRNHGSVTKFEHEFVGSTERMDTLQAAVLRVKLPHLEPWNAERRAVAHFYSSSLRGVEGLWIPREADRQLPIYHLYVIRHEQHAELQAHLDARGISTGRHYPVPCHLTPAYSDLGYGKGSMPNAELACTRGISLPIYPAMPRVFQERVVDAVKSFFQK